MRPNNFAEYAPFYAAANTHLNRRISRGVSDNTVARCQARLRPPQSDEVTAKAHRSEPEALRRLGTGAPLAFGKL